MKLEVEDNCPLNNFKKCKQFKCAWFVQMKGTNPNDGKEVDEVLSSFPALWEVNNREDYKALGGVFSKFAKMERLPLQHIIDLDGTTGHKGNSGNTFYTSNVKLDLTTKLDITEEDHKTFGDFMDWIKVHNDGIIAKWDAAVAERQDVMSHDDMKTVDEFIDVELESANA